MINSKNIVETLQTVIPSKQFHEDMSELIENGYFSSFELMKLIATLEETYGIAISADDVMPENFDSIDAIVSMVNRLMESV